MYSNQRSNLKGQNSNSKFKSELIHRCFQFSLDVIHLSDSLPNKRSVWIIVDQLIRSATSIGANLVEGKSASSRKEFKKFHEIALKSANETKYWIALLKEANLADRTKCDELLDEANQLSKILAASVISLKK